MSRRLVMGAVTCLLLATGGCAHAGVTPELADARVELERAHASALAGGARKELVEADAAMARAESAARAARSAEQVANAEDAAYVARRKAQKARLAGLYAADLEALDDANRGVDRLLVNLPRKAAADDERARVANEVLTLRRAVRTEFFEGLSLAGQVVHESDDVTVLQIAGAELFARHSSQLRHSAEPRLRALARVILSGPTHTLRVKILDDPRDTRAEAKALATSRAESFRGAMVVRGVSREIFGRPHPGHEGTGVELLLDGEPLR